MKIAGIVCDNYKLEKFKRLLNEAGFTDFEVVPFRKNESTIKVKCSESDYPKIAAICKKVEREKGAN